MTIINEGIVTGADDVWENVDFGDFYDAFPVMFQGHDGFNWLLGVRFQTVGVPQGATVDSATVTFQAVFLPPGGHVGRLYGDDVDDAPAWSISSKPSQITPTTTYAPIVYPVGGYNITLPLDVTAIVQEIVDRDGWSSGNDIRFAGSTIGAVEFDGYAEITAYDMADGAGAPTLEIEYTEGGGGGEDVEVDAVPGGAEIAGAVPAVAASAHRSVTAVAGSADLVGSTASVVATATVVVDVAAGAGELAGSLPTVTASEHVSVAGVAGASNMAGSLPVVSATAHVAVQAVPGEARVSGGVPVVGATADVSVAAVPGAVQAAGSVPVVAASAHVSLDAVAGAASLAGSLPAVATTAHVVVDAVAGNAGLVGSLPTVAATAHVVVQAVAGAAEFRGSAADVAASAHVSVDTVAGAASLAGSTPSVGAGANIGVDAVAGSGAATGSTANVVASQHRLVEAVAGEAALAGSAPDVLATADVDVDVIAGAAEAVGAAPVVAVTEHVDVTILPGAAVFTGALASVTVGVPANISPVATDETDGWRTNSDGTDLHTAIDEAVADDDDYVRVRNPSGDAFRVKLDTFANTDFLGNLTVSYRLGKSGPATISQTVRLVEGEDVIGEWEHTDVGALTTYNQAVNPALISNFSDLYLEFEAA